MILYQMSAMSFFGVGVFVCMYSPFSSSLCRDICNIFTCVLSFSMPYFVSTDKVALMLLSVASQQNWPVNRYCSGLNSYLYAPVLYRSIIKVSCWLINFICVV